MAARKKTGSKKASRKKAGAKKAAPRKAGAKKVARKKAPRAKGTSERRLQASDADTVKEISGTASRIHSQIL